MITDLEAEAAQSTRRALARRIALWLLPFAALGVALVVLFPDSYQQDGGFHYLFARWALEHPRNLVDVWGRPLFTTLYALPARAGYPAAKLLTVAIALATAWHTARLADEHGLPRAELAVPLLFLQPSFLLLSSETMTEPLFALVLVVALRLHRAGRVGPAMWVAGLLPLTRPEGFFVCLLWGAVTLWDGPAGGAETPAPPALRAVSTLRLAAGVAAWWLASTLISRDPLFIVHDWPSNWAASYSYGTGPLWQYWLVRNELLAGPVLFLLFALGLVALLAARRAVLAVAALLLVAGLHSVFYRYGLFGSAGYARYLVCVSAPMALCTLAGWNLAAGRLRRIPRPLAAAAGAAVLLWGAVHCLAYVDGFGSSRDARAVAEMHGWFLAHPRPVTRLVFSQAYMAILFGRDPGERPILGNDPEKVVEVLRKQPAGTLVFWDRYTGPQFHRSGPAELERAGYELLRARTYELREYLPVHHPAWAVREQELYLYYKP